MVMTFRDCLWNNTVAATERSVDEAFSLSAFFTHNGALSGGASERPRVFDTPGSVWKCPSGALELIITVTIHTVELTENAKLAQKRGEERKK